MADLPNDVHAPTPPGSDSNDQVPGEPTDLTTSPPVVMAPQADGVDVVWAVTGSARGWVEWVPALPRPAAAGVPGESGGLGESAPVAEEQPAPDAVPTVVDSDDHGFVPQGDEVLRVRIRGWQPGTDYLIRTRTLATDDDREATSEWKRVRTLDPGAVGTTFTVWNDTHQRVETLTRLDDAAPGGDFLVWNGDVCNNWTDPAEIVPTLLSPAGRDITRGRPLCFVWGNHDVRGPHAYRVPQVIATPDHRPYYAFRSGPVAAIFLNTGEDKPDDHPSFAGRVALQRLRQEQAVWLAEVTRRPGIADAPYRVVFCHIPLRWLEEPVLTAQDYADGEFDHYSQPGRPLWHDPLVAWGAQVIISGHTHQSEWIPADADFPYAQLTGGGPASWQATWIEGHADSDAMTVTARRLDESIKHQASFAPLGPLTPGVSEGRRTVGR